jgi:biotin carboxyl carrier protein
MRFSLRSVLIGLAVLLAALWLVARYRAHRQEVTREAAREEPVIAPGRVVGQEGTAVVALAGEEVARIGLALAAVRPASAASETRLYAEVVPEAERAAVLRAPIAGRFVLPPNGRWPGLGERVRAGVPLAQVSDARPLSLPISGIVTRVGAQPGSLVEAGQALLEVADYSHPLVRVIWSEAGPPPHRLAVGPDERGPHIAARLVGAAPEADPVTRRAAYLYRAERAWSGATPGTAAVAIATSETAPATAGVLIPDAAVVQWEGLAWTYRRRAPRQFERVRVETTAPAAGGWVAGAPFVAGDSVVVRGAQELLSEEFRARVTVGDESGE